MFPDFSWLIVLAYWSGYLVQGPPDQAQMPVEPSLLAQYGPGGVIALIALSFTWIMFKRYEETLKLEREEKRAAQAEVRELNKIARELMMPALTQSTAAVTEATKAVTEVMRVLRKENPR